MGELSHAGNGDGLQNHAGWVQTGSIRVQLLTPSPQLSNVSETYVQIKVIHRSALNTKHIILLEESDYGRVNPCES